MNNFVIFEYSPWFIFLCIAGSFAYAFLLYFRDKKLDDLSKKKIYFLAALRFFSVFIISLLLLSPLLKTIKTQVEKPIIILAIDNSKSIKLASGNSSEFIDLKKNIEKEIKDISSKFDLRVFSFSDSLSDSLSFNFTGEKTNISKIISQINDKFYNKNIGALIIASDGVFNDGTNPLFLSDNLNYSIYTIGLGDTTRYKDSYIKDIFNNEITFLNNEFPVSVSFGAQKLKDQIALIKITNNGKIVFSQNVNITSNDFFSKIDLHLKAEKEGIQEYSVNISVNKKERNSLNNTKNFAITVLKNKQKILILANSPHPDISAMENSLKTNSNFDVDIEFASTFNKNISDYSLVILHSLPSIDNPSTTLFGQLKKLNMPLIVIVGMQTNITFLNSLNLGLKIAQTGEMYDDVQGNLNPDFKDFEISEKINDLIKSGPPFKVHFANYNYIPQLKLVVSQYIKGIETQKPLVLISSGSPNYQSNLVFILGENFWRLRISNYRKNQNYDLFDGFMQQLVQYSVLKTKQSKFIVKVDNIIAENNEIIFKAELYDQIFQLTNTNDVNLKILDSAGKDYNYQFEKTINSYILNIGNFPSGHYSYIANTEYDNQKLENKGSFIVMPVDLESQILVADHNLLQRLAFQTAGKFYYSNKLDSLKYDLEKDQNIVSVSYSSEDIAEFITIKWIFFLIFSILVLEWFLRKFFGTY